MDIEQIERLAKLKNDGLITEQEFAEAKAKALGLGSASPASCSTGGVNTGANVNTPLGQASGAGRSAIVSPKWERRFAFFDKVGSPFSKEASAEMGALKFSERSGLLFNIWAMLFGTFYFVYLGIPKRGITLLVVSVAVSMLLWGFDTFIDYTPRWYWMILWVFYATTANYYYYIKVRYGRDEWNPLKDLFS